ncbi:MAG: HAD-IB family hydrolase [Firmicutes bacterium]|nr:HAD-IB family hydrolase [Bacillota bacterium]MCM1401237.1 HAD-IB family hydrolase [Bacteroides sp.]MCM1477214.1 HAD-IB family hydrolase [Bacteroides sp.]
MAIKPVVALFDFDGTLINRDSFVEFAKFSLSPWRLGVGIMRSLPWLISWKIGKTSSHKAKERLFRNLYRGARGRWFETKCRLFADKLDTMVCQATMDALKQCKKNEFDIAIISASIGTWIRPWAERHGIYCVIATEAEIENGRLTGNFATPNCRGEEKLRRFKEFENRQRRGYDLYVWGDSDGDKPLMEYADKSYLVNSKNNTITEL